MSINYFSTNDKKTRLEKGENRSRRNTIRLQIINNPMSVSVKGQDDSVVNSSRK